MNAAEAEYIRRFWAAWNNEGSAALRFEKAKPIAPVWQPGPPPYAERVAQILATNGSPS